MTRRFLKFEFLNQKLMVTIECLFKNIDYTVTHRIYDWVLMRDREEPWKLHSRINLTMNLGISAYYFWVVLSGSIALISEPMFGKIYMSTWPTYYSGARCSYYSNRNVTALQREHIYLLFDISFFLLDSIYCSLLSEQLFMYTLYIYSVKFSWI